MNISIWPILFSLVTILLAVAVVSIRRLVKMLNRARIERSLYFNRSTEFILILNENLKVIKVSKSILRRFRLKPERLLGKQIDKTILWPDIAAERNEILKALRRALSGDQPSVFRYKRRDSRNRVFAMQINAIAIPTVSGRKQDIVCIGQDTTVEIGTKQRLRKKTEVEDLIVKISASALTADSLRECVPGILKSAGELLDAKTAFFIQADSDNNILWNSRWSRVALPSMEIFWNDFQKSSFHPFVKEPGFIAVQNLQDHQGIPESFRNQARINELKSMVVIVMKEEQGSISGFAGFTFSSSQPPEDESSHLLFRLLRTTLSGLLHRMEAQQNMELFRQSVDAAGQGIILSENSGRIIYANKTYTDLTGRSRISDAPIWESYPAPFSDKVRLLILPLVSTGEQWTGELQIKTGENSCINTIETFHPINTGMGNTRYFVNIVTDISGQKRLEEQLIQARNEANLANREKSNHLAEMSHEIRTPLNAVIGLTYLTLQTSLDKLQKEYLQKTNTAAKNLLRIINDILDLSKIESGQMQLESVPFSIDEMLDNLADMISDNARAKGLQLIFLRSPNIPDYWIGDSFRLSQILMNLIGNAVKFTQKGSVTLNILEESPGTLSFAVEDSGIGMTEEQTRSLFTPFTQAETSTTRRFGGSGLGLSISKQIIELMGGTIELESAQGKGSRFSFSIPMEAAPEDQEEQPPFNNVPALVLSLNPDSGSYHQLQLQTLGMEVVYCSSMKEALETPDQPAFTLFDTDSYPGDIREAAYALSNGSGNSFTLILSGSCPGAELTRIAPEGVPTIILPLPYSRRYLRTALTTPVETVHNSENFRSTLVQGTVLLADDNEINRLVGKKLIERTGLKVKLVSTGTEAVKACEAGKFDMVFMDLQMPEMSGYKAASLIRQKYRDLPVIAMTASTLNDVKADISGAGFSTYIAKPIEPEKLYTIIGSILGVPPSSLYTDIPMQEESEADIPEIDGIDTDVGLHHILGDRRKYSLMITRFIDIHHNSSSEILSALELGNIQKAISLVHTLRGAAGHIGAIRLQKESEKMEEQLRRGKIPEKENQQQFFSILDRLIESIETSLDSGKDSSRSSLFDELEEKIRNSDESIMVFMNEHLGVFSRRTDKTHLDKIKRALERWDYDQALETLEDWRASIVKMNYT